MKLKYTEGTEGKDLNAMTTLWKQLLQKICWGMLWDRNLNTCWYNDKTLLIKDNRTKTIIGKRIEVVGDEGEIEQSHLVMAGTDTCMLIFL